MLCKILSLGITILFVLASADGATVTTSTEAFNKNIKSSVAGNIDILQALSDIEELRKKTNLLEQKLQSLESRDDEKDKTIRYLQVQMSELLKNDAGNETADNTDGSHIVEDKSLVRVRRQIAVPNIAFSAYETHTQSHMSVGQTIKFDHVLLNDGHGYNSYTGVFTAPISGTYLFSFHFDSRVHTFIRLNLDGVNVVDAVANPHTTNTQEKESMGGNTVVIHVGIGQAVSIEVYDVSGEVASSDKYRLSTFSGFLLYPEHP